MYSYMIGGTTTILLYADSFPVVQCLQIDFGRQIKLIFGTLAFN